MRVNFKRLIFLQIIITILFSLTINVFAVQLEPGYEKLRPVINFLNFLINVMRWGSASIGGVIATVLGWQMIINMNTDASSIAKKRFKKCSLGNVFYILW